MSTTLTAPHVVRPARGAATALLTTGALVGVLDALFAVAVYTVALRAASPARVFQGVAAALLGRDAAVAGGGATAALGLAMHFGVAYAWTALYLLSYRASPALRASTERAGGALTVAAAYGMLVWLAMSYVVVPLTRIGGTPRPSPLFFTMLVGHVFVVGLPIVLGIRARER